jgi:hypothetical protein
MHLIFLMLMQVSLNQSYEHVRLAPENVLLGSDDSAGIERIEIAIQLS